MNAPELPAVCEPDRLIRDWCAAEAAFRRRDGLGIVDALIPSDLGEVETYTRIIGLTIIAAESCGIQVRESYPPNPLGFYALSVEDIRTGLDVDPFAGMSQANTVAAGRMIVAAANNDHDQVAALVQAHLQFDGDMERSGVLLDLLGLYCAISNGIDQ